MKGTMPPIRWRRMRRSWMFWTRRKSMLPAPVEKKTLLDKIQKLKDEIDQRRNGAEKAFNDSDDCFNRIISPKDAPAGIRYEFGRWCRPRKIALDDRTIWALGVCPQRQRQQINRLPVAAAQILAEALTKDAACGCRFRCRQEIALRSGCRHSRIRRLRQAGPATPSGHAHDRPRDQHRSAEPTTAPAPEARHPPLLQHASDSRNACGSTATTRRPLPPRHRQGAGG